LGYYDNDLPRSIQRGDTTTTYSLDAMDRRQVETTTGPAGTSEIIRHYSDTSDNPTWVSQGGQTQRYVELIGGDLGLTVDSVGDAELTIANPHNDIVTTVAVPADTPATAIDGWNQFDEYGAPATANTADTGAVHYGWLGGTQRAAHDSGLILMGVRLYNPATGLFTATDPVEGGNSNAYTYPADPVNKSDTTGEWGCGWCKRAKSAGKSAGKWLWRNRVAVAGTIAFGVCVFATAGACLAAGVVAAGFSVHSNYRKYRSGSMSRRDFAINTVLDVAGSRLKPLRYGGKYAARHARKVKWWKRPFWRTRRTNKPHRNVYRSFRNDWRGSTWRLGRLGYRAYSSYKGRNFPDF